MSTYLIMIDNGEEYSSHDHYIVASCTTLADAEQIASVYNSWVQQCVALLDAIGDNYKECWERKSALAKILNAQCPIPGQGHLHISGITQYSASAVQVPEWAELLP